MKPMGPIPPGFGADTDGRMLVAGCEAESLVAEAGGTPLFVYDANRIAAQAASFRSAMPQGVALHYAVKANSYPPLLTLLHKHVDGLDIASAGELELLEDFGLDDLPVSFAGPGKRDLELERAIHAHVTINLESEREARRVLEIGGALGIRPKVAVRVNPPFALKGAGMKMGGLASAFGVDAERVPEIVRGLVEADADWRGLHIFAGSQALSADALITAQRETVLLAADIARQAGHSPAEVNLGGGFGIPYFPGDRPLDVKAVGQGLRDTLGAAPLELSGTRFAIELGRWLVGEAGVYLTRIVDRKRSGGRTFVIADGGLHHMLAASGNFGQLLRRNYPVAHAGRFAAPPEEEVTISGCLCTPLDVLADDVMLPRVEVGDLIAIFCAGAYGLSASPQAFLGHPAAREMLV